MLLVLAILLLLLFGGLGFAYHAVWLGLILVVGFLVLAAANRSGL